MTRFRFRTLFVCLIAFHLVSSTASSQTKTGKKTATKSSAKSANTPKYKGIFEPVSFSEDIKLTSVRFVDEKTGWVSGDKGTILFTEDGGENWTAQLGGDPNSSDDKIDSLFFLDAKTGWAVGASTKVIQRKLLGTRDGETWRQVGTMGTEMRGYNAYAFTSATTGVFLSGPGQGGGSEIHRTQDGGKTWKQVLPICRSKVKLDGVFKELGCNLTDLHFIDANIGYAVGGSSRGTIFVLKTSDGGATWEYVSVQPDVGHPDEYHFKQAVYFRDENNGFISIPRIDKLLATSDGGKTWEEIPAEGRESMDFAGNVGWMMEGTDWSYTTDGGKKWTSRSIRFPAYFADFDVVSPQRAYVVGDSGMIFRYSVVPFDHKAADSLDAPAMSDTPTRK